MSKLIDSIHSTSDGDDFHSIHICYLFWHLSMYTLFFLLQLYLFIQSTDYYGFVHHDVLALQFLHLDMVFFVFYLRLDLLHMQFGDISVGIWAYWVLFLLQLYLLRTADSVRTFKSFMMSIPSVCFQSGGVHQLLHFCRGLGQF